jgi:predicted HTH transcriptional regulator
MQLNLFDIPKTNKINSFYSEEVQEKRGNQKQIIYEDLKKFGESSAREISDRTKIQRHLVPDRILQLMKADLVKITGAKQDLVTNKTVTTYSLKG